MSGTIIDALLELDGRALARVWVDLNRWRWPRDLPNLAPLWWTGRELISPRELRQRQMGFVGTVMDFAESRTTKALIDEEWKAATTRLTPDSAVTEAIRGGNDRG